MYITFNIKNSLTMQFIRTISIKVDPEICQLAHAQEIARKYLNPNESLDSWSRNSSGLSDNL